MMPETIHSYWPVCGGMRHLASESVFLPVFGYELLVKNVYLCKKIV